MRVSSVWLPRLLITGFAPFESVPLIGPCPIAHCNRVSK
jgi:hypothetical protein